MKPGTRKLLIIGAFLLWAVLHAYVVYHVKCERQVHGGPVVAPSTTMTQQHDTGGDSFGNEHYIWDNWKQ